MGYSDNSGAVFLDAVLTDFGREKLARNDGSFSIVRFRFADDDIDYRFWNEMTGTDSKDKKILDTPIFEASTNELTALRYPLVTIRNSRLQFLPVMLSNPSRLSLVEQTDSVGGGVNVVVRQEMPNASTTLPQEILDVNYSIECDNGLILVSKYIPISITPFGTARYIIPASRGTTTARGGTECLFNVRLQTLTKEVFDTLVGATVLKPRTLVTNITVTGQQSGMSVKIPVSIREYDKQ